MLRKTLTIILALTIALLQASANNLDEGKRLYEQGDYDGAMKILEHLVGRAPKDAATNYYLGASYYRLGYYNAAINYLQVAEKANWSAAARDLADIYLRTYDLDAASESLDRWEAILDKAKKPYPDEIEQIRSQVLMARNMLERVEQLEIIDVLDVDSVDFFKYYRLSPDAGELLDARVLDDQYSAANPRVVYRPQNGKEMLWARPDASGTTQVVTAQILDDGTMQQPVAMGPEINQMTQSPDFPFLAEDGVTVYFAAKGDDSLGGYDIFMTRRGPDGQLYQAQNIGMPYNSPYDDYMMVIDETNDLGWFASDRKHLPGKVTIYAFRPSKMRVNYSADNPDIAALALLTDAKAVDDPDSYMPAEESDLEVQEFYFPLCDGKVYTSLADFKHPQARKAMEQLLNRQVDLEVMQVRLDELRAAYARGDKRNADEILKLEKTLQEAPGAIQRLTNQIVNLEIRTVQSL